MIWNEVIKNMAETTSPKKLVQTKREKGVETTWNVNHHNYNFQNFLNLQWKENVKRVTKGMTYKNDRKWQAFFLTLAVKAKFFCILPFCDLFTGQSVQLVESSRCRIIQNVYNNIFSGGRDVTYRKETAWQETVYSMINTTIYSMINTIIFSQWQDRLIQFIGHNGPLYTHTSQTIDSTQIPSVLFLRGEIL